VCVNDSSIFQRIKRKKTKSEEECGENEEEENIEE